MFIKKDKLPDKTPKSQTKCRAINIRVTEAEHVRIRKFAESQKLNITQFMERLIFGEEACKK
jgi:uncharacterized protein (DUF1778 family)